MFESAPQRPFPETSNPLWWVWLSPSWCVPDRSLALLSHLSSAHTPWCLPGCHLWFPWLQFLSHPGGCLCIKHKVLTTTTLRRKSKLLAKHLNPCQSAGDQFFLFPFFGFYNVSLWGKNRGNFTFLLDGEKRPKTKDLTPEQSLPVEKPSLGVGMEDLQVGNFFSVHEGESSPDGPTDLYQVDQEKLSSSIKMSEPETPAQERGCDSDGFERSSDLTKQSEGPPGKDPQQCATPGIVTSPQPVVDEPLLQENRDNRCGFCERTFITQRARERHEQLHAGKKPFEGKRCGEAFNLMPHLTRRQRTHSSEKSRGCSKGGKSFTRHTNTCGHVRIQGQEDYFECFQCGRAFIQDVHLFQHLKAHEAAKALPPRLPCTRTYFIRYQRKHDYVGERACQCCDCGKAFSRTSHLIQHYRIHAQERPYQCKLCGKCFSRPSYLTQHYQLHSQEKADEYNSHWKPLVREHSQHRWLHSGERPSECEKAFCHPSQFHHDVIFKMANSCKGIQQSFWKRRFSTCVSSHTDENPYKEYLCCIGKKLIDFAFLWWYSWNGKTSF